MPLVSSEQLSLSVSDLTRIPVEDALSEMFLPADNIVRRLLSRMEHIMQAHDISATTMAALLAPEYPPCRLPGAGQTH